MAESNNNWIGWIIAAFVALLIYGNLSRKSKSHPLNSISVNGQVPVNTNVPTGGDTFCGNHTIATGVTEPHHCIEIPTPISSITLLPIDNPPPIAIQTPPPVAKPIPPPVVKIAPIAGAPGGPPIYNPIAPINPISVPPPVAPKPIVPVLGPIINPSTPVTIPTTQKKILVGPATRLASPMRYREL